MWFPLFTHDPPQDAQLVHDAAARNDVACQASIGIDFASQASMEVHPDGDGDADVRASGSSTRPEASGTGPCPVVAHASASSGLNGGNGVSCGSHCFLPDAAPHGASEESSYSSFDGYGRADESFGDWSRPRVAPRIRTMNRRLQQQRWVFVRRSAKQCSFPDWLWREWLDHVGGRSHSGCSSDSASSKVL